MSSTRASAALTAGVFFVRFTAEAFAVVGIFEAAVFFPVGVFAIGAFAPAESLLHVGLRLNPSVLYQDNAYALNL
jgi:hypothetical protein